MGVYLDHNATTPIDDRVLDAMLPYLQRHYGNPSSVYRRGRLTRQAVEMAREQIARTVNVQPSQVIFTGGGTEANNLAIKGVVPNIKGLAVSAVEHASVFESAKQLAQRGANIDVIGVDDLGRVTEADLVKALVAKPQLVSVMTANNETGVLQDIPCIAEKVRAAGVLFHTDAVQAMGKMELDFAALGLDMLSLSAHKIYGPKGVGALIIDRHLELTPELAGGGQEHGYRSGTENVAAIVGFGVAAELAISELEKRRSHVETLRQDLEQRLAQVEEIIVFAKQAERIANTVFFAVPGIDGETLLMALDKAGMEISSGSACDSKKGASSHVLQAMGIEEGLARCAVRVSFGQQNTRADVAALVEVLLGQIKSLQSADLLAWV
jgi:cysteine desulfurase